MNLFQRLTRCWDQFHPYNAAQAMRLSVPCAHSFAQRAWDATLTDLGVGAVHIHGRRYRHSPGVSPLHHLSTDADPEQFLSDQLNTPFDDHDCPFRPFLQPSPQGTLAGIVYHHWVADSVSLRHKLRNLIPFRSVLRFFLYNLYDTVHFELQKVEGRRLTFAVRAHDGIDAICEGTHERFVIDRERFVAIGPARQGRWSVGAGAGPAVNEALATKPDEIVVFGAATEAFSQRNINCGIEESIERFRPVVVENFTLFAPW